MIWKIKRARNRFVSEESVGMTVRADGGRPQDGRSFTYKFSALVMVSRLQGSRPRSRNRNRGEKSHCRLLQWKNKQSGSTRVQPVAVLAAAGHYPAKLAPLDFGWVLRSLKLSLGIFCLVIDMNKKISAFYFLHSSNFATWVPAPACSDRFLRKNLDLLKTRVTIPCLE